MNNNLTDSIFSGREGARHVSVGGAPLALSTTLQGGEIVMVLLNPCAGFLPSRWGSGTATPAGRVRGTVKI